MSEFPNSSNPYDSLGETYFKDGNEELSLLNYKKPVELEATLKPYFDELMKVVNDDKETEMIQTTANFQKNNSPEDSVGFIGTLTIFDAFATNKPLNLNARVFSNYCEEKGKLILSI